MPFPKEKETHKNYLGNCHNTHGKTSCYVIGQVWFLISVLWIVINKWLRWNPFQEREFLFQVGAASRRRLEINLPNKTNALWFLYIHFQFFWLIILVLLAFHWRYIVFMVLNLSMIEPKRTKQELKKKHCVYWWLNSVKGLYHRLSVCEITCEHLLDPPLLLKFLCH